MEINAKTLIAAAAVAALFFPIGQAGEANAANKAAAAGSDFVYLGTAENPLGPTTILDTWIKTGGPQDVVISVSLECSLVTDVFSTTEDDHPEGYTAIGRAAAKVVVWAVLDGVPVALDGSGSDGSITFCDRVHQQELRDIGDDVGNFTIRQLQETMTANAFNWIALDLGSGNHHIQLLATVEAANTEGSFAEGGIAKRTLVVEPVDFAHGATIGTHEGDSGTSGQAAATTVGDAEGSGSDGGIELPSVLPL